MSHKNCLIAIQPCSLNRNLIAIQEAFEAKVKATSTDHLFIQDMFKYKSKMACEI